MTIYNPDRLLSKFGTRCCSMSGSNWCFLTCIQVSQEAGKVVWNSYLFKNFLQFVVIHVVKGFSVMKQNSFAFSVIQRILTIWSVSFAFFCKIPEHILPNIPQRYLGLYCQIYLFIDVLWRRKWQPTPVFLPGESQGWGSLVGCRLWGHTESDATEAT